MGTPGDAIRATEAEEAAGLDLAAEIADRKKILSGTGLNIVGLAVYVVASFGMSILIARVLGKGSAAFGQIQLITSLAFAVGAGTRFGMDVAAVRRVAIEVGDGKADRARAVVRIAAGIAAGASAVVMVLILLFAGPIGTLIHVPDPAVRAAAVGLAFVAVSQVFMGGSQGMKIMRHTLYSYWIGQSVGWIVLTLAAWAILGKGVADTVWAYTASWVLATIIAFVSWRHANRGLARKAAEPNEASALIRFGAPRAPAALLSQALFYVDLAVLSHYLGSDPSVSVYAATIRVSQAVVLFLIAVSYMFSPFVADLYQQGKIDRLNTLFKQVTRWTLGGTIPLLLLFMVAPTSVLHIYGATYTQGSTWLRIVLIGQIVNVSVGAAGYVLIMVGRTTWDLVVYALSVAVDLIIALTLVPSHGAAGAAVAQATALVFSNALRLGLVWRYVRIQPYDRYYALLLIPTAVGTVVMIAVHAVTAGPHWAIDLVATGLIGGAAYYVTLLFFGLTPEEKRGVMGVLKRGRARATA